MCVYVCIPSQTQGKAERNISAAEFTELNTEAVPKWDTFLRKLMWLTDDVFWKDRCKYTNKQE